MAFSRARGRIGSKPRNSPAGSGLGSFKPGLTGVVGELYLDPNKRGVGFVAKSTAARETNAASS